jgi:glycosyltransferase involved in cell wall biosynthesis
MEAMACGKPCIGFEVGGIPEEIDHLQNGYVAKFMDADDLAKGIHWVLDEADYQSLSQSALQKVARNYSQQNVAARYIELYSEISHTPFKP